MCEIIYELSGERRDRKKISRTLRQKIGVLQDNESTVGVLDNGLGETKRTVEKIFQDCTALLRLSMAASANPGHLLQSIQDMASQLPVAIQNDALAVQADQNFALLREQPNPRLNGSVNIFREFSRLVADCTKDYEIHPDTPIPASYFSLYSVSRFYRLDALQNLASNLIWDFGSDVELLHQFNQRLSPGSRCYLRHVKITMVENFMLPNETQPLNSKSLCDYINTSFPNLRILEIDLWPRDPTRSETGNREWGAQSDVLIKSLHNLKARVRLALRWAADCERFEREYVREGGWKCIWKDGPDDQAERNVGISPRCYELHGTGDMEMEL